MRSQKMWSLLTGMLLVVAPGLTTIAKAADTGEIPIADPSAETAFTHAKKISSLREFKPDLTWKCQFDGADVQFTLKFANGAGGRMQLHSSMQPDDQISFLPFGYPTATEQALPGRIFKQPVLFDLHRFGDRWEKTILVVNTVVPRADVLANNSPILVLKVAYTNEVYVGDSSSPDTDTDGDNHWSNADTHEVAYALCLGSQVSL